MSKPLKLSPTHKLMLSAARSMLGDLAIKVDRKAQRVTIKQDDRIEEYSYEQLAGLAEQLFPWDQVLEHHSDAVPDPVGDSVDQP